MWFSLSSYKMHSESSSSKLYCMKKMHHRIVSVVAVLLVLVECSHSTTDSLWSSWKQQHQKSYTNDIEEEMRRDIWNSNYKLIQQHNNLNHTYTLALNHLADLVRNIIRYIHLAVSNQEIFEYPCMAYEF